MPEGPRRVEPGAAKWILGAAGIVALTIWFGIIYLSYRKTPDATGIVSGVFVGLFTSLLVMLGAAWGLVRFISGPAQPAPLDPERVRELETLLGPTLRRLEATRLETLGRIKARALWQIPLGLIGGIAVWLLMQIGKDPPDLFELLMFAAVGAIAGGLWAAQALSSVYARLYKESVLPLLAANFGDLTYRRADDVTAEWLRKFKLFSRFDKMICEDEIVGTYRDHPIKVVELRLEVTSKEDPQRVFDGLLVEIVLSRNLTGTTIVTVDPGALAGMRSRMAGEGLEAAGFERVRLEDPVFEKAYQVHGTDQIEARALLTPAFMERFLALGERVHFERPVAVAEGNRLTVALPKSRSRNLFEPPSYLQPAGDQRALVDLNDDIASVLQVADTVIDLNPSSTPRG